MSSVSDAAPEPNDAPGERPRHRRGRFGLSRRRRTEPAEAPEAEIRDDESDRTVIPADFEQGLPDPLGEDEDEQVSAAEEAAAETHRSYYAKRGSVSLAPIALLAALACAAVLGRQAYLGELTEDMGLSIGLTVAAVALLIFAVGVSSSAKVVRLDERGLLKVVLGEHRHTFDLAQPGTELEQVGEPGKPGWKILALRRTRPPVTIDATMVDPRSFTEAVRQWRPNL